MFILTCRNPPSPSLKLNSSQENPSLMGQIQSVKQGLEQDKHQFQK